MGYAFSRSEIERDIYYPTGHADAETEQANIRKGVAKLLNGELSIPMAVKEFPVDEEALKLRSLLTTWLAGGSSVKVDQQ